MNEDHHDGQTDHDHDNDGHTFEGLDRVMGISLVLGFIFMMLVEQIASSKYVVEISKYTIKTVFKICTKYLVKKHAYDIL